ncbi:hypothetical protein JCM6294_2086 [Bacteroides pyogenes DSM 20611 = JCM 6294]|uniref:Uncharacterized protein n=1 Tax=Bacteroides pyogenes DSM 20611 = JCM 6294 TaxID=1121100 RepID=W4PHC0_9BACE|nr:hypothetical protein JCM6294_2086 [Bacteroides pyogenes DSM 20611 = JCM 6294]
MPAKKQPGKIKRMRMQGDKRSRPKKQKERQKENKKERQKGRQKRSGEKEKS